MSPEVLTAFRIVADLINNDNVSDGTIRKKMDENMHMFLDILKQETEWAKADAQEWAVKRAGIITK